MIVFTRLTRIISISFISIGLIAIIPSFLVAQSPDAVGSNSAAIPEDESQLDNTGKTYKELLLDILDSIEFDRMDSISQMIDSLYDPQLRIYGHDMFKIDSQSVFNINNSNVVDEDYVLGPNDDISVSIFGISQFDGKYVIDNQGFIYPSEMPKIALSGVRWNQAKSLISRRFSGYYRFTKEQISISLLSPRPVTVSVFGDVERPGSYNLSASNTVFNAIVAAKGVKRSGSVRKIKLIDSDGTQEFDAYSFMSDPSGIMDMFLADGAIIQVPTHGNIVSIEGAINRPMKYELRTGEGLKELLKYCGGLRADAVRQTAQIERYTNDQQMLIDIPLAEILANRNNYQLQNGDHVIIKIISKNITNSVSIEGAVEFPGNYSLQSAPRLSQLINKSALTSQAKRDIVFLFRLNDDNTNSLVQLNLNDVLSNPNTDQDLVLKANDRVIISEQKKFVDSLTISISGAVRFPATFPFDPDSTITVEKAVLLAGGLTEDASSSAYLIRKNVKNKSETKYVPVDIKTAMEYPDGPANRKLKPLDQLSIMKSNNFTDVSTIRISGAVRTPSELFYDESLTIKDVFLLSGGFKREAARNRIELYRIELDENQPTKTNIALLEIDSEYNIISGLPTNFKLQPNDEIVVRSVPDYELQKFVKISGEVLFPGEYAITKNNESISNVVTRAGGITTEAFTEGTEIFRDDTRVITNTGKAIMDNFSSFDLPLMGGDSIHIPKIENVVFIELSNLGIVNMDSYTSFEDESNDTINLIAVAYESGKSAKWYINEFAGGFGRKAERKHTTIKYANGAIKKARGFRPFLQYPKPHVGSTIIVPARPIKVKKLAKATNKSEEVESGTNIYIGSEPLKLENPEVIN